MNVGIMKKSLVIDQRACFNMGSIRRWWQLLLQVWVTCNMTTSRKKQKQRQDGNTCTPSGHRGPLRFEGMHLVVPDFLDHVSIGVDPSAEPLHILTGDVSLAAIELWSVLDSQEEDFPWRVLSMHVRQGIQLAFWNLINRQRTYWV